MAVSYPASLRNSRLNQVRDAVDAGPSNGLLRIYDGVKPSPGGAATTLLAELTFSDPSFPAASSGSVSANAITEESSAPASGTATWFRVVDSNGNFVIDGTVGTTGSGEDLEMNSVAINAGQIVNVSSFDINEGNS